MLKRWMRLLNAAVCAVFVFQTVGCGTILYPERKGQRAGRIDMGVALLDAVGLFFFLIPGVIAFAVDFNNGTIYLPGTSAGVQDIDDLKQVKFDRRFTRAADMERIIQEHTGQIITFDQADLTRLQLESTEEMIAQFEHTLPDMPDNRTASTR